MDEKLQRYLESFKKYTMEMILNLKNDDIDNFEVALEKRTQIVEKISDLNFDRIEFKKICRELDIISVNDELSKIASEKKNVLKDKILELKRSQNANNAYHTNLNTSNVFSKKV